MQQGIILMGLMGSGKSTVGHLLAQKTKLPFIDIDTEIEKKENMSVAQIFSKKGEAYFRDSEHALLQEKLKKPAVISAGGGIVVREDNRTCIKQSSFAGIYLLVSSEQALQRIKDCSGRPLLASLTPAQRIAKLDELHVLRDSWYRETARIIIETNNRTPEECAEEILKAVA